MTNVNHFVSTLILYMKGIILNNVKTLSYLYEILFNYIPFLQGSNDLHPI